MVITIIMAFLWEAPEYEVQPGHLESMMWLLQHTATFCRNTPQTSQQAERIAELEAQVAQLQSQNQELQQNARENVDLQHHNYVLE